MSLAPTPDGPSAPLICLYGAAVASDAGALAHLPGFLDRVQVLASGSVTVVPDTSTLDAPDSSAATALRTATRAHPGRDVILLALDTRLPPHWWPRLVDAAAAFADIDVISPLTRGLPALDPWHDDRASALEAMDAHLWSRAERVAIPSTHWSPALSYWRAAALHDASEDLVDEFVPASLQAVVLDHLLVEVPRRDVAAAAIAPTLAALARRLDGVGGVPPPWFGLDQIPVVLHVLHGWGGGAQRFVEDLARGDSERHHLVLIARGDADFRVHGQVLALHHSIDAAPLREIPLAAPIATTAIASSEYATQLQRVLRDYGVGAVMLSSLIGHSLDALRTGLPTSVVCHDYYPIWPRLHADFGDASRDFSSAAIAAALPRGGQPYEFAEPRASAWVALRAAYLAAIEQADATLVAPSAGVEANLRRIEPRLAARRWQRIEHGFAGWASPPPTIATDPSRSVLRVVVPGRIRGGKGEDLIAAMLPQLPEDVELILLGAGAAAMRFFGQARVHVVLDYARDDLPAQLHRLRPDAALLLSTVSETYSYLLSELWSLRVPVIATALGSFAERISNGENGLLVAPDAATVNALLAQLRDDCAPLQALRDAPPPMLRSVQDMARDYRASLPIATARVPQPDLLVDGRALLAQARAAALQASLDALRVRIDDQQLELERRAEWAHGQEKLAQERTRWARSLDAQVGELTAAQQELEREVEARGAWARNLIAETEQLKELVASEQRRLEGELHAERLQFAATRAQLDQILGSSSWRLTRPLRWLRRKIGALPTRVSFQLKRVLALRHRLTRSLRTRGLKGTIGRIGQEFRPPQPAAAFVLPEAQDQALPVLVRPESPRASVIVPVYNHFHHTRTCLQALAACGDATPFEIIVVDDGSSDETQVQLAELPGLHYHRNPENLGFIGACNAGAAIAQGEFLVFLNNDTAVQPGWLDALLRTFAQHDEVGLAGSKLVYPDGRLQEAGGIVFSDASGWNYGRFDDPAEPRYNFVREVDYCSGAAIAIRKSLFERFGGFDAHYAPAYYEDTDLAMKVRQAGLRVLYQPASVVVHFEGVTSGTDTAGSGIKRYQVINQQKFLERWRDALTAHPVPGTDIVLARQHRSRRHVLIIDATTPQPDHDSGSLRLVNAMRVMRAEGCSVTFFADNRAWVERYTAELQQLGVEVLWHPWLNDPVQWFAEHGKRFDLVFISRHYIASSYVGLVRLHAPQATLVFDTVDLHYLREQREAELAGREDLAQTADATRTRELALIRSCDITLVVSPVEQELLRHEAPGARVEVLSNVHEVYGRRREFSARKDLMFMGGYQHPPNIDAATWFVHEIFPRVRERLPDVRFHLIGSKATDAVRALGEVDGVEFHGFVPDVEPFLDGCRLALAPLRYGAGVKGKVNMSMSYGQPVIATPIAVEGMHAEIGRDVLVAEDAAGFADAIVRAYGDEALWNSLSDHGLENVRRHFSFDAARAAVRRLFE